MIELILSAVLGALARFATDWISAVRRDQAIAEAAKATQIAETTHATNEALRRAGEVMADHRDIGDVSRRLRDGRF